MTSPRNTFMDCLKKSELKKLWEPEAQGTITRWNQIRPDFPTRDQPVRRRHDSGTFDYWTDAINGKEKASRGDYTASEDDNVLVQGLSNDPNALGYFGFAYYEENKTRLKLLAVDNETGQGCVQPSTETIPNGTYVPLSRPIFIYAKASSPDKPEVREFLRFYVNPANSELIAQTGYIPFPKSNYEQATQRLNNGSLGTVFTGTGSLGAKIDDLFGRPWRVRCAPRETEHEQRMKKRTGRRRPPNHPSMVRLPPHRQRSDQAGCADNPVSLGGLRRNNPGDSSGRRDQAPRRAGVGRARCSRLPLVPRPWSRS